MNDVFLIADVQEHPACDQEAALLALGVRSVVGISDLARDGELFCVLLFSLIPLGARVTRSLRPLGVSIQLAADSVEDLSSTSGQPTRVPPLSYTGKQLSELIDLYEGSLLAQSEMEAVLQHSLLLMPDSFVRLAGDGTILDYRGQSALGHRDPPETLLGHRIQDVFPPDTAKAFLSAMACAKASSVIRTLEYLIELDTCRAFEARIASVPEKEQFVAVIRDITKNRRDRELVILQSRVNQAVAELRMARGGESEAELVQRGLRQIKELTDSPEAEFKFVVQGESPKFEQSASPCELFSVLEEGKPVAVARVGGKTSQYTDEDRQTLSRLSHELWQLVKQRRSSEEINKLAQALMQNPHSVVITDIDANIEYVNDAFLSSTGFSREEVIGQNTRILNSGKTPRETYTQLWGALSEGRIWRGEFNNQRKNGESYDEFAIVGPIRDSDGTITHYVALKEDITEKKRLGQELDAYRHSLENQVRARTADLAVKTESLRASARFDRSIGQILSIFNRNAPCVEMLQSVLECLNQDLLLRPTSLILVNQESETLDMVLGPPGEERPLGSSDLLARVLIEGQAFAIDDPETDPLGVLSDARRLVKECIVVNIVPVVYKERMLAVFVLGNSSPPSTRYSTFLEQLADQTGIAIHNHRQFEQLRRLTARLNERERKIAAQNADLERASRLKSEFLANMSHELRTPLNAIIGFSEVLNDGLVGEFNEQQGDYLKEILTAGHYLLSLINDILDLSKIEAGKMDLALERIDPKAVCHNALTMVRKRAAHLELRLDLDDAIPELWADERMLKQVLYNLLSNAVKFTPAGSVSLSARSTTGPGGERVCFAVEDTGIGIAPEDQVKLFQPFQQVDGSAARKFEGTGLGLSLCKQLVELHGGEISLTSEPDVGSRFSFWLPERQRPSKLQEKPQAVCAVCALPETELKNRATPLVLLIEDEDPAAELLSLHLGQGNYQIVRATSAYEAQAVLEVVKPDLIALDILLPKPDGWRLLKEFKSDPKTAEIPVVIVSIIAEESRSKAIEMGAAEVLQKPVSPADLLSVVERHIPERTRSAKVI